MISTVVIDIVLVLAMVVGLVLTPIGLPGNWLIVACALAYGFITGWQKFGWQYIVFLSGAALLGEVLELISASAGARRYGSSRGGEVAALVGTIIGAIVGSGIAPVIGSLIGAFAGAFLGTFFYEYSRLNDFRHSLRAGMGALLGKTMAVVIKEVIGVVMIGTVIYYFFR